ncbi:MAG: NUDIX domain-containing protein [Phycisphaerae bacterium]|jgi:8-oxo-dGTP diphosphatase|nr:NUDIX domain-containing protein [Phycisphaerae bacterium]MBT5408779.1 NUDIX domain-containing protein [Phycisphaerae bacterium]MBT6165777.1 NUDIX domain-containing protein [Phycisphaerae bacterium]MBT7658173.1 NUDIX domain-containing protein [Phycisphaerae bacterium]|tara:strand:- start:3299 stop:3841 length:543 start_codon:yes stop_codon:yes gene_type:complete
MSTSYSITDLPYKIAVLCYLYDEDDQLLMLHRAKDPNKGKYSPIGGKLEVTRGESPHACAVREIQEESGVVVSPQEIRLSGMLAEKAYYKDNTNTHWLLFLFEVTRAIRHEEIQAMEFEEGTLEWVPVAEVENIDIPDTDKKIIWNLVKQHRGGFFAVDIDCSNDPFTWEVNEEWTATDV